MTAPIYFENDYLGKEEAFWVKVLWYIILKLLAIIPRSMFCGKEGSPKSFISTMYHGGESIKVFDCFSAKGTGKLVRNNGIMKKEDYLQILRNHLNW